MQQPSLSEDDVERLYATFGKRFEELVKKYVNSKSYEAKQEKLNKKRKKKFATNLSKGSVVKKLKKSASAVLTEPEIKWAFEIASDPEEQETVRQEALQALVLCAYPGGLFDFVVTTPDERIHNLRKQILDANLLDLLIRYASKGQLTVHREVSPSEVEM